MFGGIFNRMYYGDPKKPDLNKEDIKQSRVKTFFTVVSVRFWQLIELNLMYAVFWLPAYLLLLASAIIFQETGQSLDTAFYLFLIPCLVLTGPATAGVTYVLRNWARDEHAWVWSDFWDAWKANWKQGLLMMLINGVLIYIMNISLQFYRMNAGSSFFYLYLYYMVIVMGVLLFMMNMFIFPMMVTYRMSLMQIIRNAFLLTMIRLPFTFLIFLLAAALVFASLYFLVSIPFFLVGLTFPYLIVISYVNMILDKFVNSREEDEEESASEEEE